MRDPVAIVDRLGIVACGFVVGFQVFIDSNGGDQMDGIRRAWRFIVDRPVA